MEERSDVLYHADLYVRLSKEDGDVATGSKYESNSIANQKELLKQFLKSHPEIRVYAIREDDGYTGTNFNRPGFRFVLQDIKDRKINCLIVKDLSRIGRNYLEVGRYVQEIFPQEGIRLIAINDHYDSIHHNDMDEDLILPFKNLLNDAYSRDMSMKIRSNLHAKRKRGEYTGAFVVFGYQKSEEDHNSLVIDPYAANVVRDIFRWKLEGMNQRAIADRLNEMGIPSPMEYKRIRGIPFECSFKVNTKARWCAQSVARILKNEIYQGNLIQGIRGKTSYRSDRVRVKNPSEWVKVEHTHAPIIDQQTFMQVQDLLLRDTRTAPEAEKLYPYAGLLFCGNCRHSMVRKQVPGRNGKKYIYYICAAHKRRKEFCSSHSISEENMGRALFLTLQKQIAAMMDRERILSHLLKYDYGKSELRKIKERIFLNEEEIRKYTELKHTLYEDLQERILDREEYRYLAEEYQKRIQEAGEANRILKNKISDLDPGKNEREKWLSILQGYRKQTKVPRAIVVRLVDRIYIYEGNRILIRLKYQDIFESCQ